MNRLLFTIWCWYHSVTYRNERGLSQSTENAILLAGAVAIAITVVTVISSYVEKNLPTP